MITFEEKVMSIAQDLVVLYKDIDYYDVIDPINDIDNIEEEFISAAYENLMNKDSRLDITLQLEELKMDVDNPSLELDIASMLERIEDLFQPTKIISLTDKFENIKNTGLYNNHQLHEIEKGITNGVDIRYYLSENFNENQMHQIRMMLEFKKETNKDIEISILSNPNLSYGQMGEIRRAFESGLTNEQVLIIANPSFNRLQMSQIRRMFEYGTFEDVRKVAFPLYKFEQLWVIREIYEKVENKDILPDNLFDWENTLEEILVIQKEIISKNDELPKVDKPQTNEKKGIMAAIEEIRNEELEDKKNNRQKNNSIDR